MKTTVLALISVLSTLTPSTIGSSTLPPLLPLFSKSTCPLNILSCTQQALNANACCLPALGIVVLSLQWQPGLGPADQFTLHGLWPNSCGNSPGPASGCDRLRSYNNIQQRLENYPHSPVSFMGEMATYWSSSTGDNNQFWSHEWTKHGTCVSTLDPGCMGRAVTRDHDVYAYFSKAIELRKHFDVHKALADQGIVPGSTPNVNDMHKAVQMAFGADAQFNCNNGQLSEVWLYFQVQNKDKYMIREPRSRGSCRGYILYPVK
ncbi:ribonuclease T2-like [Podila clonocystis]|nr:ribonuclease T2-like [Podila clonocystis]